MGQSRTAKRSKSLGDAKPSAKSRAIKNKRLYCVCKGPDDGRMMVACDACDDWFHVGCIGMTKAAASKLKSFTCPGCAQKKDGPATASMKKQKQNQNTKKKEKEETATPKRLAKRTRKGTVTATVTANKRQKTKDKKEDEDEAENSSGHNESEVEDDGDENEEEVKTPMDGDQDDEGAEEENDNEEESSYEQERKRRMEENQRFLQSLGLFDTKKTLGMTAAAGSSTSTRKYTGKRQRWSTGDADLSKGDDSFEGDEEVSRSAGAQPVRKSRRLQNEPALDYEQIKEEVVKELADRPVMRRARGVIPSLSRGFHGNGRVPDTEDIVAPFSLASVATTIWSLGHIYQGDASPEKYYSSKQCMYRHPYPVGYRASIVKWGSVWIMEIHEGEDGPLFVVRQKRDDEHEDGTPIPQGDVAEEKGEAKSEEKEEGQESFSFADEEEPQEEEKEEPKQKETSSKKKRAKTFKRFEGPSATQPWTKACIDGPSPGSRVSGPLVFGFSDPLTVHVLNRLRKKASAASTQQ